MQYVANRIPASTTNDVDRWPGQVSLPDFQACGLYEQLQQEHSGPCKPYRFLSVLRRNFAPMNDAIAAAVNAIAKGDTRLAEGFFRRPGGRRYLENLSLILLNTLLPHSTEKEEMFTGFVQVLDKLEDRILRQYEGEEMLEAALHQSNEESSDG